MLFRDGVPLFEPEPALALEESECEAALIPELVGTDCGPKGLRIGELSDSEGLALLSEGGRGSGRD